jgi:hypothetical protein
MTFLSRDRLGARCHLLFARAASQPARQRDGHEE